LKDKEKTDIFDKIWNFFASVKLAIVTLIILALTSIIGTIIEQNAEPANNIKLLSKIFGDRTAPTVYNILLKLDFMNMYHSWWFIALLTLFSINLIVCSLERFPKTLRLIKTPMKPLAENVIKTLPIKKEFTIKTNLKIAKDEILNTLTALRYRVFEATEEDGIQLYSQKGKYTRLGVYIVHLSILLIFIGAIIGARFGFSGFLNLPEGASSDVAYTRGGKVIPLGFTIRCNWYNTEYYRGTDTPQEFQSELVIIENGREVLKKIIEVNSPLTYKGITFYQASYGMIPDAVGEFDLNVISKDGKKKILHLRLGESFEIPNTDIRGTILDFSPALGRDPQTGRLYTYAETMVNPAIKIRFEKIGSSESDSWGFTGWILKRYPETGILPGGHRIEFLDYWGVEYTGLQVSRDPGVGVIYFACVVMTLGLYVAFFMSHKKIWIKLTPYTSGGKNSVKISLGGSASKNRLSFEKEIEKILSKASQAIEGRSKK
jgi:cytochrome c biogenesis protein